MKFSWTLTSLFLLQAATGASADCSAYTDCLSCVEGGCAFTSEGECTETCDVSALIDCYAIDNYQGYDGPELCAVGGFDVVSSAQEGPSLLPDISEIGGHASIGEDDVSSSGGAMEACLKTGDAICTMEYVPVVCSGMCEYSNACEAESAGYAVDEVCVLKDEMEEVVDTPAEPCPTPGEGMCTMEYEPVVCSGTCEYSNGCEAELAGFTADVHCVLVNPPTTSTVGQHPQAGCPATQSDMMCTMEYDPVVCGAFDCEYPNMCLAAGAGYDTSMGGDCALVNPATMDENATVPIYMGEAHNDTMGSPCSELPTCDSCLKARMDCKWTAGTCYEECIADASCWSPTYQVNMSVPEICELAGQEGVADEGVADVEVATERQINSAQEQVSESPAVRQAVSTAVAFAAALGAVMV